MAQPLDPTSGTDGQLSSLPIDDMNISPNPVLPVAATSTTAATINQTATTTKRVEFNFVPSMMMFDNDHHQKQMDDGNHDTVDGNINECTTIGLNISGGGGSGVGGGGGSGSGSGGGTVMWDTETDHMLSYFLSGGDQGSAASVPVVDFTTMPTSVPISTAATTTNNIAAASNGDIGGTDTYNNHNHNRHQGDFSNTHLPPPTPVVHFYSNSTPISSNVFRATPRGESKIQPPVAATTSTGSHDSSQSLLQQQQQQHDHLYANGATENPIMTGSTSTTQSQSSSSSSLSSLPTNIQLYQQQLQMQRMLAGSGGGGNRSSSSSNNNTPLFLPTVSAQQQQQLLQSSPNTLLHPQMLLYPPQIPSHGGIGSDQQQQQQLGALHMYDGESPLSPALMIGNGTPSQHENMFLPRSNSFYENAVTTTRKSPNNSEKTAGGDVSMGPPVSRQPSITDIQAAMAAASASGYVWPPPGTTSSTMTTAAVAIQNMTMMPTMPFTMMSPYMTTTQQLSSTHGSSINISSNNSGSVLLPNIQPYMYATTATMQGQPDNSMHSSSQQQPITEEETEEKRSKRLERNRESARKCRLKKKERLSTVSIQVTELHQRIEQERSKIIRTMVPNLMQQCRYDEILNCVATSVAAAQSSSAHTAKEHFLNHSNSPIAEIIRGSGPSSTMMRSVLDFQYSTLKDITLPQHQKLLLWLTTQKESYFTLGKEQYYYDQQKKIKQQQQQQNSTACDEGIEDDTNQSDMVATSTISGTTTTNMIVNVTRPNVIKISSKQVGEELMNGGSSCSSKENTASKKKRNTDKNQGSSGGDSSSMNGSGITTSAVYDGAKTWPLFCYELKLSVDQEERFVGKHRQIALDDDRQIQASNNTTSKPSYHSLACIREDMAVAVTTTENLAKAVGVLSHMIAQRDENSYSNILRPEQVSKYYQWLSVHRGNLRRALLKRSSKVKRMEGVKSIQPNHVSSVEAMNSAPSMSSLALTSDGSTSLQTICRQLSEVLQISSRQHETSTAMKSL